MNPGVAGLRQLPHQPEAFGVCELLHAEVCDGEGVVAREDEVPCLRVFLQHAPDDAHELQVLHTVAFRMPRFPLEFQKFHVRMVGQAIVAVAHNNQLYVSLAVLFPSGNAQRQLPSLRLRRDIRYDYNCSHVLFFEN